MRLHLPIILGLLLCLAVANAITAVREETNKTITGPPSSNTEASRPDSNFWSSLLTSFTLIGLCEFGDKTFLIAAILAMRHARRTVFCGAISALTLMTLVSVIFGYLVVQLVVPQWWIDWAAAGLFILFGGRMIKEGWQMTVADLREDYEEVSHQIEDSQGDVEAGPSRHFLVIGSPSQSSNDPNNRKESAWLSNRDPILLQTFTMTFLAEWGDRSQIATIVMGASKVISIDYT